MSAKLNLNHYFSEKEIIKVLSRKRAVEAKKGHDSHFYFNISSASKSPHQLNRREIFSLFPSRKQWIRLNKKERHIHGHNSIKTNTIQIEKTIWRTIKNCHRNNNVEPAWLNRLLRFIADIKKSVFDKDSQYEFGIPKIIPILKDKNERIYRPISVFELKDQIIAGQIAKYLSNCFDPLFSDSSYAFRISTGKNKAFSHHQAIQDIIEYRNRLNKPVYAVECDIKKFYDCVNHEIIQEEFKSMVGQASRRLDLEVHHRAIYFFESYLRCFSFNHNVFAHEKLLLEKVGAPNGFIPWVDLDELLEIGSDPLYQRIGVPQGGAISCLIANIILNKVDRIVESNSDDDTFYARFCDDMIILHPSREFSERLLNEYLKAIKDIKLISHSPKQFSQYGREFWDDALKSKFPYRWTIYHSSKSKIRKNVPWLSFVGYQIRYDGVVRVRKKSIAKELIKQVKETDKVLAILRKSGCLRISAAAIRFRLQQRLISMSISKFKFGEANNVSMCWCAGFEILKSNRNLTNQIRKLDRNREKQVNRLQNHLDKISTTSSRNSGVKPLRYYGYHYSYYKQFVKARQRP